MSKSSLLKENNGTIQPIAVGDKKFRTFAEGISPKMNVIVQLEFELAYDGIVAQGGIHNVARTPSLIIGHTMLIA